MKKTFFTTILLSICIIGLAQIDTISTNIYQQYGNLGIGTKNPASKLSIELNISSGIERNMMTINNLSTNDHSYTGIILKTGENDGLSVIQDYGINYTASAHYDFGGFLNVANNSNGVMLHANSADGIIKFYTGHDAIAGAGYERMRIDSAGYIGIGAKSPEAKLHIADGDIYISDIEKGIIMKSPDGNCWRGIMDNTGQLNFTSVNCPESELTSIVKQQESSSAVSVNVFPNPSGNNITIDLNIEDIKTAKYSIYNLNGKLEGTGKIKSNIQRIDISGLTAGVYLLNIYNKSGNRITSEKIIKQ